MESYHCRNNNPLLVIKQLKFADWQKGQEAGEKISINKGSNSKFIIFFNKSAIIGMICGVMHV